jgi:CRP-like cAMP-binding protein
MASALAGTFQLLLLAHTPVSRKAFQFLDCHMIEGVRYLRVDYRIQCNDEWYSFMPFVLLVLVFFSVGLPGGLLLLLWVRRKTLKSTSTYRMWGWLYEPYQWPWWEPYEHVMMLMLTSVLMFLPLELRTSVAMSLCMFNIGVLNYFRPHKNRVLFWLTEISFIMSTAKYFTAQIISDEQTPASTLQTIGNFMIVCDIFMLCLSFVSMIGAFLIVQKEVKQRTEKGGDRWRKARRKVSDFLKKGVTSVKRMRSITSKQRSGRENSGIRRDDSQRRSHTKINVTANNPPTAGGLEHTRSTVRRATIIVDNCIRAEQKFNTVQQQRQRKQRRNTQLRLLARQQLRQSKCLQKCHMFSQMTDEAIKTMVDAMVFKKLTPGSVIFMQNDVADKLYITTQGECEVLIDSQQVGTIGQFEMFGEGMLNATVDNDVLRNATVVTSGTDPTHVLYLNRIQYDELKTSGVFSDDIVKKVSVLSAARNEANMKRIGETKDVLMPPPPLPPSPFQLPTEEKQNVKDTTA